MKTHNLQSMLLTLLSMAEKFGNQLVDGPKKTILDITYSAVV
jgi:hypothetical protein